MIKTLSAQKTNLLISIIAFVVTIIFIVFDNFSVFSIFIGIINLFFIYLYQYRGNSEYLSYGLIFITNYIFIYLFQFGFISQWLSVFLMGIFSALIFYKIFFNRNYVENIKIIYSAAVLLIASQISVVLLFLRYEIAVKALFATLTYYLISGIIKLYHKNKLDFYSVFKYGIVFFAGILLLILNSNYLI